VLHKFLPHLWIDVGLVTKKAVKSDEAGVPTHLWDQRCTLVLPRVTPVLDRLHCTMLHRVTCTKLLTKFQDYLNETYGPDWLQSCSDAERPFGLKDTFHPESIRRGKIRFRA
jgi:hypothetical protein